MLDIKAILNEHQQTIATLFDWIPQIEKTAQRMTDSINQGATVFWLGNGGSAADAQHMAAELIGRFKHERRAIPSIALTTDTSVLTALGNDYDFNIIFARQLEGLCKANDIVMALSTSGNSENVLRAVKVAKEKGAYVIGFTGHQGGKLKTLVDTCFVIPSKITARIQEAHHLLCHLLCEWVDNAMAEKS